MVVAVIDDQYADELRKFVTWVPAYGIQPAFIAVGPTGGDWRWTRSFFPRMTERSERRLDMVYGLGVALLCGSNRKESSRLYRERMVRAFE